MAWYIEDLRPIATPTSINLVKDDVSNLLQPSFYGKCNKDAPPTAATPYTQVFMVEETGALKCIGEYLDEGWKIG